MKKMLLIGLILIFTLFFIQANWKKKDNTAHSLELFNNDIKDFALLTHTDLYKEELHRLSFQFNQEPYLQLNQRYSRKMISTTKVKKTQPIVPLETTVIKTEISSIEMVQYTLQRIEQLSGSFQQAKIYATVNDQDRTALRNLCRQIQEQYVEYSSLVICLYTETETGVALAQGENAHYSEKDIFNSWLVFYSYHPVEGDYFDDNPGKYLVSSN
jgi:hypothetical protein